MTRKPPTDLAASVRDRLRQLAARRRQEPHTRYGVERLLYRLSRTAAGECFVVKGAVLYYIWEDEAPSLVTLQRHEWSELMKAVRSGALAELGID